MVALLQGVGEEPKECHLPLVNQTLLGLESGMKDNITLALEAKPWVLKPRFSTETFFSSLLFTIIASYVAFLALNYLPSCQQEMNKARITRISRNPQSFAMLKTLDEMNDDPQREMDTNQTVPIIHHQMSNESREESVPSIRKRAADQADSKTKLDDNCNVTFDLRDQDDEEGTSKQRARLDLEMGPAPAVSNPEEGLCISKSTYYYLLVLMAWNCVTTFGFMPSLQVSTNE